MKYNNIIIEYDPLFIGFICIINVILIFVYNYNQKRVQGYNDWDINDVDIFLIFLHFVLIENSVYCTLFVIIIYVCLNFNSFFLPFLITKFTK